MHLSNSINTSRSVTNGLTYSYAQHEICTSLGSVSSLTAAHARYIPKMPTNALHAKMSRTQYYSDYHDVDPGDSNASVSAVSRL